MNVQERSCVKSMNNGSILRIFIIPIKKISWDVRFPRTLQLILIFKMIFIYLINEYFINNESIENNNILIHEKLFLSDVNYYE